MYDKCLHPEIITGANAESQILLPKVCLTREYLTKNLQPAAIEGNATDSGESDWAAAGWVPVCAAAFSRETTF